MSKYGAKFATVCLVAGVLSVAGCSDSAEEKAFRQSLIDKALNDETRKAGNAFLVENAKRPSVILYESGLQVEVLASGARPEQSGVTQTAVTMANGVEVHYRGTTIEGTIFEDTYAGKSVRLEVRDMLKGWQLALLKMQPGDVWRLYLPADLAYGARSPSEFIPANSALIFELSLLSVYELESN